MSDAKTMWLLLAIGDGEGCDYTIGCNRAIEMFQAECAAEASIYVREWLDDHGLLLPGGDKRLTDLWLVPVMHTIRIPYDEWLERAKQDDDEATRAERERAEFEEFKRLRAKFGKAG